MKTSWTAAHKRSRDAIRRGTQHDQQLDRCLAAAIMHFGLDTTLALINHHAARLRQHGRLNP